MKILPKTMTLFLFGGGLGSYVQVKIWHCDKQNF
jgi:hypothetical protein